VCSTVHRRGRCLGDRQSAAEVAVAVFTRWLQAGGMGYKKGSIATARDRLAAAAVAMTVVVVVVVVDCCRRCGGPGES